MRPDRAALIGILVVAALLRFYGLDWSVDPKTGHFHRFHPDEATVMNNAAWLGEDLTQIKSAYGLFPVYFVYAVAHVSGSLLGFEAFETADPRSEKLSFLTGRAISALLGTTTVLVLFLIGHRAGGAGLGLVAASLLALSPGHIQQCHFYTIDASFTFWVTLSLYLILRLPSNRWWLYGAIGLAIGISTGHRFVAALLGIPFIVAQIWHPGDRVPQDAIESLRTRAMSLISPQSLACAALVVVITLVATPTLLFDYEGFFDTDDQRNFLPSIDVATGKELRLWNLYDLTTTPYLFYVTDLFPAALGTTAALSALVGLPIFARRPTRIMTILLAWGITYFILTGGLFTKPIRYTVPVLPVLCCLAAFTWSMARHLADHNRQRFVLTTAACVLLIPTAAHGLAQTKVYLVENIRFEAKRFIQSKLPKRSGIIAETGGFPTTWMTSGFSVRKQDPGMLFMRARNHVLPSNVLDILAETLSMVDYFVLTRENRSIPYRSTPDRYPIAAEFYERMNDGSIGYQRIAQFNRPLRFLGLDFNTTNPDPTIAAYDRPTIEIYRRTSSHDSLWSVWRDELIADDENPDRLIIDGIAQLRRGDYAASLETFERAIERHPEDGLARLCRVESIYRTQTAEAAVEAFEKAQPEQWDFAGLTLAGIPERGAEYTRITQTENQDTPQNLYLRKIAARAMNKLAQDAMQQGKADQAIEWYEKSIELNQLYVRPFRDLGILYMEKGRLEASRDAFSRATELRPDSDELWLGLAVAYSRLGQVDGAVSSVKRAMSLGTVAQHYHKVLKDLQDYLAEIGRPSDALEIAEFLARSVH